MSRLKDFARSLVAGEIGELKETIQSQAANQILLKESLGDLERILIEDTGWLRLTGTSDQEFSREGLTRINQLARVYWLKNPLIKRAVATQAEHVFGQGLNIQAHHETVNAVIQKFLDDRHNKAELTSHQAYSIKETELQVFGNLFFAFFVNKSTGRVKVRTIPMEEVHEIVCNPEDSKEPYFYKRVWSQAKEVGQPSLDSHIEYYPDWRYNPPAVERLDTLAGHKVNWDTPVFHIAVNKLSDMKFGVSEVYAGIDWAKAYTGFLENWSTIVAAYARFAWQLKTPSGKAGVADAKARIQSGLSTGSSAVNPSPATGSVFIGTPGVSMDPIRTGGATTSAEDGRRLLLMVSAATGVFEHYFGDPSTGNLATATSMERPMEMMFTERQRLWVDVLIEILQFVVDWAARAPKGALHAGSQIETDEDGEEYVVLPIDPETEEPIDRTVDVVFPPLLEKSAKDRIAAVVSAATLDGKPDAGTIPDKRYQSQLLLQALGEEDVDSILDLLYPPGEELEPSPSLESQMTEAVRELREAVVRIVRSRAAD